MPDIALLDVHLNEPEDGFALARWLRSRSARIGILMLTVAGEFEDVCARLNKPTTSGF
jgi:DNA-binding response OmpR family regulator